MMNDMYVFEASLLTPLGAIPAMIRAAVDAGLNSYQLCNLPGAEEQSLTFSAVPDAALDVRIPQQLPGMSPPQIRLLKLASFALLDLKPRLPDSSLPLFLAGPQPYYKGCGVNQAFINNLVQVSGVQLEYTHSRYIAKGRAGFMEALDATFNYFRTTGADYALMGGVDSFYDLRTLGILHEQNRLSGDDIADGFVPGEAAAFLLVVSPRAKQRLQKRPLLKLHNPGLAYETGHLLGNLPYRAQALAGAVADALKNCDEQVRRIFSSENGESHYTSEISLAVLRNHQKLITDCPIHRPAECFGDLGAAFPFAAIGLASVDIHDCSGITLVTASSDGGLRGAVALSTC